MPTQGAPVIACPYRQLHQRESAYHGPRRNTDLKLDHDLGFGLSAFLVAMIELETIQNKCG